MTPNKLVALFFIGIIVLGLVIAVVYRSLTRPSRTIERRNAIVRGETKKSGARDAEVAARRKQMAESLKELENRDKKSTKLTLEMRLEQAGLDISEKLFIQASVASAIVFGLVAFFLLGRLYAIGGLLIGGFGLPNWIVAYLKKKRILDSTAKCNFL